MQYPFNFYYHLPDSLTLQNGLLCPPLGYQLGLDGASLPSQDSVTWPIPQKESFVLFFDHFFGDEQQKTEAARNVTVNKSNKSQIDCSTYVIPIRDSFNDIFPLWPGKELLLSKSAIVVIYIPVTRATFCRLSLLLLQSFSAQIDIYEGLLTRQ